MPRPPTRRALQPAPALEHHVEHHARHGHESQSEGIAERPVQFGHETEVHAVDGADEGRREQDGRPTGDLLHLVALIDAGLRHVADLDLDLSAQRVGRSAKLASP